MDGSPNASTRSRIPRPTSRLPMPIAGSDVRPSSSRDSLRTADAIAIPRLRGTPSRDQLSSTRDRDVSTGTVICTPSKVQTQPEHKRENNLRKPLGPPPSRQQHLVSKPANNVTPKKLHHQAPAPNAIENETRLQKPRQSLSERTTETLSQLPPSPAARNRGSSFFGSDSPMRPPSRTANGSRPGSSHQPDTSMPPPLRSASSRPGSSAGYKGEAVTIDFRASTNTSRPPQSPSAAEPSSKHPMAMKSTKTPLKVKSNANLRSSVTPSKLPPSSFGSAVIDKSPNSLANTPKMATIKSGSKTITARPLRHRAPVGGLFRKPSMPELDQRSDTIGPAAKKSSPSFSNTSSEGTSVTSQGSIRTESSMDSVMDQTITPRKASLTLREQIAKAKAAKRAQTARRSSGTLTANSVEELSVIPAGTFDFGLAADPFNQQKNPDESKRLLRKRIDAARTDGRLNIAAMELKEIPSEVMNMYNLDAVNGQGGSWAESVDLTRFVAADNDLEAVGDDVFPDIDPLDLLVDDDSKGNQFGGLETLDLHGNLLKGLPLGLRRLELLTTLNLSKNKLQNDSFDVISQIPTLRDLKIGNNDLSGELSSSIAKLQSLEVLDIQHNRLTSLPQVLVELVRLRVLNISENAFTSLSFEALYHLPLIELYAAKNKLEGVLIALHDIELPHLQVLDVSFNALTSLALDRVRLPSLHRFSCSANRLTGLPDMAYWKSLLTLAAEDNNIADIPEGFVTLAKVRNVDFTGNNLKVLDDRIGLMESLDIFRISGNPLREKKFSSMTVEELKKTLSARLAPEETELVQEESSDVYTSCPSSPARPSSSDWPVKAGGILDRSNTQSYSLNPVIAAQIATRNSIRELDLRHNLFQEIPSSVEFFASTLTSLSLAHNQLTSETSLKDDLELPVLKELNLSSNILNSLQPLIQRLRAPQLEKLDMSFNRLALLPVLRTFFPRLTVVLASNNAIKELYPDAVKGLTILDCSSNDINSLNPRIGLLGGPGGLERLDVSGNRFRVPKYTVLEKGTEATLAWLRDRIPAGEMSSADID